MIAHEHCKVMQTALPDSFCPFLEKCALSLWHAAGAVNTPNNCKSHTSRYGGQISAR